MKEFFKKNTFEVGTHHYRFIWVWINGIEKKLANKGKIFSLEYSRTGKLLPIEGRNSVGKLSKMCFNPPPLTCLVSTQFLVLIREDWTIYRVPSFLVVVWFGLWGLRNMPKIWVYDIMTTGLVYPLSEHVDIFPVRLVPTFHWVFSIYLILAIYLHSRLYPCGRNKTLGLDPSHLV
jgi:hypothetical protein